MSICARVSCCHTFCFANCCRDLCIWPSGKTCDLLHVVKHYSVTWLISSLLSDSSSVPPQSPRLLTHAPVIRNHMEIPRVHPFSRRNSLIIPIFRKHWHFDKQMTNRKHQCEAVNITLCLSPQVNYWMLESKTDLTTLRTCLSAVGGWRKNNVKWIVLTDWLATLKASGHTETLWEASQGSHWYLQLTFVNYTGSSAFV